MRYRASRRWLVVVTLVGLVFTGAAVTTHASHTAHLGDGVAASTHIPSEQSLAPVPQTHLDDLLSVACADCGGEILAGDQAMLLALGCAFVAMLTIALICAVRARGPLWILLPREAMAGVVKVLVVALKPPDLVALGISRT